MKFRQLIFVFIILVVLLAWLTKPDNDDFSEYYASIPNKPMMPPVIEENDYFLYTTYTVTYFSIASMPQVEVKDGKATVAIPGNKRKYLGLFGRFWQLD